MNIYDNLDDRTRRAVEKYDKIAEKYAEKTANSGSPDDIQKFIEYLPVMPKILDVGCSAGRDCVSFRDLGASIVGVDLSAGLIEIAREKQPEIEFINADARLLPLPDADFDGVWAHGLIHEMDRSDMLVALQEMKRVLKPGGILYVRTKMGEGIEKSKDMMSSGEEREVTYLSVKDVETILSGIGLKKLDVNISKSKSRELYWISAYYKD
ncbi:MAG: class I SAM-dependent methyltransferase [Pseudomonadota bacterium]